jgi:hypothetical protein
LHDVHDRSLFLVDPDVFAGLAELVE